MELGPWMPTFVTTFRFRNTSIYFIAVKLLCLFTPPEELISMQYTEEINDSKNPQNFVPFSYKRRFFGSHNTSPDKSCYYFPPLQMRKLSLKDFGKGPVLRSALWTQTCGCWNSHPGSSEPKDSLFLDIPLLKLDTFTFMIKTLTFMVSKNKHWMRGKERV